MPIDKAAGVDSSTGALPNIVRTRLATEISDEGTGIGAAVAAVAASAVDGSATFRSITSFGTVGLGDDTAIVQAAVDAGVPLWAEGIFELSSPITLRDGLTIIGPGSGSGTTFIQNTVGVDVFAGEDVDHLTLCGFKIEGSGTATADTQYGIRATRDAAAATTYWHLEDIVIYATGGKGIWVSNLIVSTLKGVVAVNCGTDGFHLIGESGTAGTSVTLEGCYANTNEERGIVIENMAYSSLVGCASEGHTVADYAIIGGLGVNLSGCGAEFTEGVALLIDGGYGVMVSGFWTYDQRGVSVHVTDTAVGVVLSSIAETVPNAAATNSIVVDTGSRVTVIAPRLVKDTSYATGTTTVIGNAAGDMQVGRRAYINDSLFLGWADGANTDAYLYRGGASEVGTDAKFTAQGLLTGNDGLAITGGSELSGPVTLDTEPSSAAHATTKLYVDAAVATKRIFVPVTDYGAVGDGVVDDTTAVNSAIAYANSLNPGVMDGNNVIGVTLFFPVGRYKLTSQLTAIVKPGVDVRGAGENGTVLLLSHNGPTFRFGDATSDLIVGGSMSDMKIEYLATPGGSAVAVRLEFAAQIHFSDLLMVNVPTFVEIGVSAARWASSVMLTNIRGYVHNSGMPFVRAKFGGGLFLDNVRLYVGGVTPPTINRTSTMTTVVGTCVVRLGEGSWDTVQMTACFFERFDSGVWMATVAAAVVNNVYITACYFDYHKSRVIHMDAVSTSVIAGVRLENNWYASWELSAIQLSGAGTIRGVTIGGGQIASAGEHGIIIGGSDTREIQIADIEIQGVNRTDVNAYGVIVIAGSHFSIHDIIAGYDQSWGGLAWQAYQGVGLVDDLDHWSVHDNDLDGTAGGLYFGANAAGSTNRHAHHNRGVNGYDGYLAVTVPASTVAFTNTTGFDIDYHIHGGVVTVITKNGTTITGMTLGMLTLSPGETWAITYSVVPTVTSFVHP